MGSSNRINISAPNLVNICVDDNKHGEMSGRIYHCYDREPMIFTNIIELLTKIEELFDVIGYPQASTKTRLFMEKQKERLPKPKPVAKQLDIIAYRGNIATFVTNVKFRQNSTWQGEVFLAEQDQMLQFANTLELIKKMDAAIQAAISD